MINYFFSSIVLIAGINFVRITLVVLASLYYKENIKRNIELKPKFLVLESLVLALLITFSFWLIDTYLDSSYTILLFSLFLISLIPSYDFIISPIKYIFSKKEYSKNQELEGIIKEKGFDYNVIIIKGNIVNAYATGVLPFSKTILIGENLKNKMTEEGLLSIIYHEVGHLKLNHLAKLYFVNTFLSLASLIAFFLRQYYLKGVESSIYEPLTIFVLGVIIGLFFWYIPGKIQYKLEFEADSFASKIVGVKKFEKALLELDAISDGDVAKGGITHPSLLKRIENIKK